MNASRHFVNSSSRSFPFRPNTRFQVQRIAACSGPLACHAIQDCLYRYLCLHAAASSRGDVAQKRELESWFVAILDTIIGCLDEPGEMRLAVETVRRRTDAFTQQKSLTTPMVVCHFWFSEIVGTVNAPLPRTYLTVTLFSRFFLGAQPRTNACFAFVCFSFPVARTAVRVELSSAQRLRCAVFLLQLLSNVFKSERGASHPERTNRPSASEVASVQRDSKNAAFEWESDAVQACARATGCYLGRMVQAATALKARGESGDPNVDHVSGSLTAEDAGYWVLALLSDMLKYLRKEKWSCGGSSLATRCKRRRDAQARGREVSASLPSSDARAEAIDAPDIGEDGSSGLVVNFSSLAKVVAGYPLGRSKGAMDVALKWLEVTKVGAFRLPAK